MRSPALAPEYRRAAANGRILEVLYDEETNDNPPRSTETRGCSVGAAAGSYPHRQRRGNSISRILGPLGASRKRRDAQAMRSLWQAEQRRGAADFVTSMGSKNIMTIAAEAQAKAGHDVQQLPGWETQNHADLLEPMDDVMKRLTDKYGPVNGASEYLFKSKGHWVAVPTSSGTQNKGPCGRISVLKQAAGIDIVKMYPAQDMATPEADNWTYDAMLKAAEAFQKIRCRRHRHRHHAGFGGYGGSMFAAFGAEMMNANGDVTIDSGQYAAGSGIRAAACEVPACRRGQL